MFSHFLRKLGAFRSPAATADARALRVAGRRWLVTPDALAVIGPAGPDLDRWLADGLAEVVKTGPHRTVYRVALPAGAVYVKHCRVSGFRAFAREVLRPAKARLEFENALALRDRGVPAVLPLAWGGPDSPWPGESFLITRSRDEVLPFLAFAEQVLPTLPTKVQNAVRRQLAVTLGRFFARLHDAGVAHPDPHPGNLLVELPASHIPRFFLIDLHAIRLGRPLSWPESRANLLLFNRWFQLRASRADRLRFWHSLQRSSNGYLHLSQMHIPSHRLTVTARTHRPHREVMITVHAGPTPPIECSNGGCPGRTLTLEDPETVIDSYSTASYDAGRLGLRDTSRHGPSKLIRDMPTTGSVMINSEPSRLLAR